MCAINKKEVDAPRVGAEIEGGAVLPKPVDLAGIFSSLKSFALFNVGQQFIHHSYGKSGARIRREIQCEDFGLGGIRCEL